MRKYLPYLLILVVISVIVILAVANSVPNANETKSDPLSCQCSIKSDLELIAKGIITDIKYTQDRDSRYIQFNADGKQMMLDYGKTAAIFNKSGAGGVIEGEYYYVYDWDGTRIIWSQTPKTLDNAGHLADPQ